MVATPLAVEECACEGELKDAKLHSREGCWKNPPTLNRAIRDAVKNGGYRFPIDSEMMTDNDRLLCTLDPLFWQSLGRARKWETYLCECQNYFTMNGLIRCPKCRKYGARPSWMQNMVNFTLHLTDGKDAELFFATLQVKKDV